MCRFSRFLHRPPWTTRRRKEAVAIVVREKGALQGKGKSPFAVLLATPGVFSRFHNRNKIPPGFCCDFQQGLCSSTPCSRYHDCAGCNEANTPHVDCRSQWVNVFHGCEKRVPTKEPSVILGWQVPLASLFHAICPSCSSSSS